MIKFGDAFIDFSNMGLFVGGEGWIHPESVNRTYELIFVVKGKVFIEEDEKFYELKPGDMICLVPEKIHRGYKKSDGTSFFWLHFFAENYSRFGVYKTTLPDLYNCSALMKHLNHLAKTQADNVLIESKLLAFLLETKNYEKKDNKLFNDVSEYVRVNVCFAPKVKDVAEYFRYNADYLSRLFIKNCGLSLKKYIDKEREAFISDKLLNTTMTLKEIAAECSFDDDNALIKFFSKRVGCSPSVYRNKIFATHINCK